MPGLNDPRVKKDLIEAFERGKIELRSSVEDLKKYAKVLDNLIGREGNQPNQKLQTRVKDELRQGVKLTSMKLPTKGVVSDNLDISLGGRVPAAQDATIKNFLEGVSALKQNVKELGKQVDIVQEQGIKLRK